MTTPFNDQALKLALEDIWAIDGLRVDPEDADAWGAGQSLTRRIGFDARFVPIGGLVPLIEPFNQILCELQALSKDLLTYGCGGPWDSRIPYRAAAVVQRSGQLYVSQTEDNLNNDPSTSSVASWRPLTASSLVLRWTTRHLSQNVTLTLADDRKIIAMNTQAGSRTVTMPDVGAGDVGVGIIVVKTHANNTLTVRGHGADTIRGQGQVQIVGDGQEVRLTWDGESWLAHGEPQPVSSETVAGLIEIASPAEADADESKASDSVAVTPKKWWRMFLRRKATAAQLNTGTNTDRFPTPKALADSEYQRVVIHSTETAYKAAPSDDGKIHMLAESS